MGSRRCANERGITAKPRVPGSTPVAAKTAPLTSVNSTAAHCTQVQTTRRNTNVRASAGPKAGSVRDPDTPAHEQQRSGHDGSRTAGLKHLRRRQNYANGELLLRGLHG